MHYLDFLRGIHKALQPPTYLEVGIRGGDSLALSRTRSVGIDPAFQIKSELSCDVSLFRTTSDEYFARTDVLRPLGNQRIAYSFIDGMHLFEYALRDFINVEKHSDWSTAIVFDDMLPRSNDEAARDRHTRAWAGDVYKIIPVLQRYRPDLILLRVDTEPTGLLLVLGCDPNSTVLSDKYDEIIAEFVTPDPQVVPTDILTRAGALPPTELLKAPFWRVLRQERSRGTGREKGLQLLRQAIADPSSVPTWRRDPIASVKTRINKMRELVLSST